MSQNRKLFYFGCLKEAGHFFFIEGRGYSLAPSEMQKFCSDGFYNSFDGCFTPKIMKQGDAKKSEVPPFKIVAWHDFTVDSRPGSHSAFLGIGYDSHEEMMIDAAIKFPTVIARQTVELNFVGL